MTDRNTQADSAEAKRSRISLIAIVLILLAVVGAYFSAGYSRTLSGLLREQSEFQETFGEMNVEDPSKVAIVAVKPTGTDLPPWMDPENIWVFRVYIPAGYDISLKESNDLIAADSPLSRSGGGGSFSSGKKESQEIQIAISTISEDGDVKGCMITNSGAMSLSFPKDMALDSPDDLVLDTIVKPDEPMRTFAVDEAICLWRLRNKEPSDKMLNRTKLYHGIAIYLYDGAQSKAFKRWSAGKSSSMAGSTP